MLWFQLKPGVVLDSLRDVHCAVPNRAVPGSDGGELRSWCQRAFHLGDVQEVTAPTQAMKTGQAPPGDPCVGCLLRLLATADHRSTAVPVPIGKRGEFAVLMRKAQWLLDDAAHDLAEGRCTDNDLALLAETLDHLASAVRARARQPAVIDPQH